MLLSLLLALTPAQAGTCDAKVLTKALTDAGPAAKPAAFAQLASCDPAAAKLQAIAQVPQFLAGPEAFVGAISAIEVGAGDTVTAWIDTLQSDERASALRAMGESCATTKAVQDWYVISAGKKGDLFWTQRWYKGLEVCSVPAVQDLLTTEISRGLGPDRTRFFGVLETYSRNLGGAAVPKLKELAVAVKADSEAPIYVVNAFADAAQVGSTKGMDAAAAAAAIKAIVEVAPELPAKAIEQARVILEALGAEQEADLLAGVRYASSKQKSGQLLWGAVGVETAACKNGKTQQRVHISQVNEPGKTWPDDVREKIEASARVAWSLDLADKCKGTGTFELIIPNEPLASPDAYKAWADDQVKTVQQAPADKRIRLDEQPLQL